MAEKIRSFCTIYVAYVIIRLTLKTYQSTWRYIKYLLFQCRIHLMCKGATWYIKYLWFPCGIDWRCLWGHHTSWCLSGRCLQILLHFSCAYSEEPTTFLNMLSIPVYGYNYVQTYRKKINIFAERQNTVYNALLKDAYLVILNKWRCLIASWLFIHTYKVQLI